MKNWIVKTLGLKGSWSWAKKQMLKGEIVRCKHWAGALKYKIDSPENKLLQHAFIRDVNKIKPSDWETSNHHLSYEDFTDYEIVK